MARYQRLEAIGQLVISFADAGVIDVRPILKARRAALAWSKDVEKQVRKKAKVMAGRYRLPDPENFEQDAVAHIYKKVQEGKFEFMRGVDFAVRNLAVSKARRKTREVSFDALDEGGGFDLGSLETLAVQDSAFGEFEFSEMVAAIADEHFHYVWISQMRADGQSDHMIARRLGLTLPQLLAFCEAEMAEVLSRHASGES